MTAVEWFYQRIFAKDIELIFKEAKEMEKQQIMQSYNDGKESIINIEKNKSLEQYYNEKYGK